MRKTSRRRVHLHKLLWGGGAGLFLFFVSPLAIAGVFDTTLLDDFNNGTHRNKWHGDNGVMEEFARNKSISIVYETVGAYSGRSLKLTYDLNTTSGWNGYYLNLNSIPGETRDLTGYRHLSFWIKGAVGGVEHLKVGLENASPAGSGRNRASLYVNDYLDRGITAVWQKVSIPLDAFANLDSKANAKTLTFVFEKSYTDPAVHPSYARTATVYIDEVRFSTVSLGSVRIDSFGDNWSWSALGGNWGDMLGATHSFSVIPGTFHSFAGGFQSNFDMTDEGAWQGHYLLLGGGADGNTAVPANFSGYRYFKFWARAGSAAGNPDSFKVEIQSTGHQANITFNGLTTVFQPFVVDLNSDPVASNIDKTAIKQMNIIYENARATNKSGTVYFDEFEFSNTAQ